MAFNPTLQSDVGYERPVGAPPPAPSMFEGLVNAASNLLQSAPRGSSSGPSKDEQFAMALDQYSRAKGVSLREGNVNYQQNWQQSTPEFLRMYPQFTGEFNSWLKAQGIEVQAPNEVRIANQENDKLVEFTGTPLGYVADQSARRAATDENGNFNAAKYDAQLRSSYAQEQATQASILTLDRTIASNDKYWQLGENAGKALVREELNFTASVWDTIQSGGAFPVPADVSQAIGWTGGDITPKNVALFMTRYRPFLAAQVATATRDYLIQNGAAGDILTEPSQQWYTNVMGPVDDIIKAANEQLGDPGKVMKWYQDGAALSARTILSQTEAGRQVLASGAILDNVNPELRTVLATTLGTKLQSYDFEPLLNSVIATSNTATPDSVTTDTIVQSMSTEDTKKEFDIVTQSIGTGQIEPDRLVGWVDRFISLNNRIDPTQTLGADTWNKVLNQNSAELLKYASTNPEFAAKLGDFIRSDMKQNFALLEQSARSQGFSLTFDGTNIQIGYQGSSIANQLASTELSAGREGFTRTPEYRAFMAKVQTLSQLGQVGEQVRGTFAPSQGTFNLPEEVRADSAFTSEVTRVAKAQGIPEDWLYRVIDFESAGSWNPAIRNPTSSATGLIQFMADTAKGLGTTTDALAKMTRAEQMAYVEKYLEPYKGRIKTFSDLYAAVLWPAAVGKDESYALFTQGTPAYEANKSLDANGDGVVSKGEAAASVLGRSGFGRMTTANTAAPADANSFYVPLPGSTGPTDYGQDTPLPTPTPQQTSPVAPSGGTVQAQPSAEATTPTQVTEEQRSALSKGLPNYFYNDSNPSINNLINKLAAEGNDISVFNTYEFNSEEEAKPYLDAGLLEDKYVVIGGKVFKVDNVK